MTLKKHIATVATALLVCSFLAPSSGFASTGLTVLQSSASPKTQTGKTAPAATPNQAPAPDTSATAAAKQSTQVEPTVVPSDAVKKTLDELKVQFAPNTTPSPDDLEKVYLAVWVQVANSYHNPAKVVAWGRWRDHYHGKLKTQADLEAALTTMLSSLGDGWTGFTPASAVQPTQAATTPTPVPAVTKTAPTPAPNQATNKSVTAPAPFVGPPVPVLDLGFTLSKQVNGDFTVDYLTYGTPAYNSDLRHGDVIKSIGGKALAGLSEQDAKALTSAKLNDKVEIVFNHDSKDDKLTLTSAATPDPKVLAKSLPNGSVYMRLPNFSKEGLGSFEQTLVQVEQQSHDNLAGLVLDLRGNPGGPDDGSADGAFNNAVGLASIFIADGPIVTATTRNGRLVNPKQYSVIPPTPDQFAGNPQLAHIIADLYRVPLVIITDNSTGGAAEIFAGAMKDNKRAVVIGTATYGRALGYTREQLPIGGVVTITTLDYFTPAGVNLANQGLAPNMVVEHKRGSKDDEAVATSIPLISHLAAAPKGQAQGDSGDDDNGSSGIMNKIMASFAVAMMILGSVLWAVYERQRKRREAERKAAQNRKTNSGR